MSLPAQPLSLSSLGVAPVYRASPAGRLEHQLPRGLSLVDWNKIRAEHERHRHSFSNSEHGFKARGVYHGWLTSFDRRGFALQPDTEPWIWGLDLIRYGYPGHQIPVGPASRVAVVTNELRYERPNLTEWFVNQPEGLEHGFTLGQRPAGGGESLELAFHIRGSLQGTLSPGAESVDFRTAAGAPALLYGHLVVRDRRGQRLPARLAIAGPELRIVVQDRYAEYPIVIDPIAQQAFLKASNTGISDRFGSAVAIFGDTVVVGAQDEDSSGSGVNTGAQSDNSADSAGAAYVFTRTSGTWSQQAYLKASNTGRDDNFGRSVAISGDTVVVGAPGEDSNGTGVNSGAQTNDSAVNAGAAYVFTRTSGAWSQQAYLKASNTGRYDKFGESVSIFGDTVVVGAIGEESYGIGVNGPGQLDNSAIAAGAAYVFARTNGTWGQQAYVKASNPGNLDYFGSSVAISGDTVVVGAPGEASNGTGVNGPGQLDNSAYSAGAVYVFVRASGTWSQQAFIKASNTEPDDNFGNSVAISGDTVVVGAPTEASNGTGVNSGAQSDNSAYFAGAAYVFVRASGTWSQRAYLKASNTQSYDRFGRSVAISGDTVVVGAVYEDSNGTGVNGPGQLDNSVFSAGAAYVFVRANGTWSQEAYLKASNTGSEDEFGHSVAISGDTMVVGAWNEATNGTGVNSGGQKSFFTISSGAAYVFSLPTITALNPAIGSISGGETVVIRGTKFTGATSVSFGAATASMTVDSDTQITVLTPAGSVGAVNVVVTAFSASSSPATFTYYTPPTLSPTGQTVTWASRTGNTVTVTANAAWTAVSSAAWLTVTGGATGTNNGTVTYSVAANTSANSRTGTIAIGGRPFTVTQGGAVTPSASGSGPVVGSGVDQTLTFQFSHPEGVDKLGVVNVLINTTLNGGSACYIAFSQIDNLLFLVDDGGPEIGLTAMSLGSGSTAQNSQCTIRGTGSSAVRSGNLLTLTLNISFSGSFRGSKVIYTAARDNGSGNSGWKTLGAAQIPEVSPAYPRTEPMSPATVTTASRTISTTFRDVATTANITTAWTLINSAVSGGQACYIAYFVPGNLALLLPDDGNAANIMVLDLGGTGSVENTQCRIYAAGSSVTKSGGMLTLNLNVTLKSGFSGPNGVWTAMQTTSGQVSPWRIAGNWFVR